MSKSVRALVWVGVTAAAVLSVATIAIHRGEEINAMWLVVAAVCSYALGYRFYSKFIAARVLTLDALRATPAERLENGRDFVRTNKWVVFGHHFAPIALLMGIYLRRIRPGKVLESSVLGFLLVLLAIWGGQWASHTPSVGRFFTLTAPTLAILIIIYGFAASALPVWLLLAPRDYLSTFVKLGTIAMLALGIVALRPTLHMPALPRFIDGTGPVFAGNLFPFAFVTIACGAISGFHSLISSGTTPKMIARETQTRMVGYGAMMAESFVGIMAMIAACTLQPGTY